MKQIEIIVEKTRTGYSVYTSKYPIATTGKNLQILRNNMVEALNLYFEEQGKTFTEADLKVTLDLPQFFEFYKVINATALSERIGMNQSLLAQYIHGNKKPSASQTNRIVKGIHNLGKELAEINFLL